MAERDDSELVKIKSTSSAIEAEMLRDLLSREGIAAHTPGTTHNALIVGAGLNALEVPLLVPRRDAERARAILAALEVHDGTWDEDAESGLSASPSEWPAERARGATYRTTPERPTELARKPVVAVAAAFVMPGMLGLFGAGHFYVREYWRGALLLATGLGSLGVGVSGNWGGFLALPLVVFADALGASGIARAGADRRRRTTVARGAAIAAPFVALAAMGIGAVFEPRADETALVKGA